MTWRAALRCLRHLVITGETLLGLDFAMMEAWFMKGRIMEKLVGHYSRRASVNNSDNESP